MTVFRVGLRASLLTGIAITCVLAADTPARAENANQSENRAAVASLTPDTSRPIEERQSYALRLMMQVYDGREDLSHTQLMGVGRVRKGNRSLTRFDFGDGAVVIEKADGRTAASRFLNMTGPEQVAIYNYDTRTLDGNSSSARFHNAFVRPLLGNGPALGADAVWQAAVPGSSLGVAELASGTIRVELSREYFSHAGKPMVLVHYAVPAFRYIGRDGRSVTQWGRGFSLSDPGFGMIYINSALHRAVASGNGDTVPYRFARTMVAANEDGSAMLDYREVPQLAPYIDAFFSAEVLRVVPTDREAGDGMPLDVARHLDIVALSIAEDGANEAPIAAGSQTGGDRGVEVGQSMVGEEGLIKQAHEVIGQVTNILNVPIAANASDVEKLNAAEAAARQLIAQSTTLADRIESLTRQVEAAEKALATNAKYTVEILPGMQRTYDALQAAAKDVGKWQGTLESIGKQRQAYIDAGRPIPKELDTALSNAQRNLVVAKGHYSELDSAFSVAVAKGGVKAVPDMTDLSTSRLSYRIVALKRQLGEAAKVLDNLVAEQGKLANLLNSLPVAKVTRFIAGFGDTPVGKVLDGVSHGLNVHTTATAGYNVYKASQTNMATGQVDLTRDYSMVSQGFDLLGLTGNALTKNMIGVVSDGIALVTGSISDIYVINKAYNDTIIDNDRRHEALMANMRELTRKLEQEEAKKMAALEANPVGLYTEEYPYKHGYDLSDPRLDPETGYPKPGYWEYLKKSDPQVLVRMGIDPDGPVGGWPGGVGPEHRPQSGGGQSAQAGRSTPPTPLPPIDLRPDYPTAKPRAERETPRQPAGSNKPEPAAPAPSAEELALQQREKRRQEAQAALDEYQQKKLDERKQADADKGTRTTDTRISELEVTQIITSTFDVDPVAFSGVGFSGVAFDKDNDLFDAEGNLRKVGPDDFVMTPFDSPDVSKFPPTDPKDLDGYPGVGEYPAYTFETMTGKEPDLSRWAAWLATQDVRKLEQLAIAAGYPSLAFALADAEAIIRDSMNTGFRQYANRGPNCAGYTGCVGSIGPWKLAYARIRLGDILAESRDVFSTGGLSDIGISGFNLMYMLRDHGLQDGDLVDVEISQFGRTIFSLKEHFLLNDGSKFNVNLRPGVAQMVITALNEGSASPNTAQVTVDKVVRGDAVQSYSLRTGETAVLRIEADAKPE